jgi:hypothetical protein
MLVEIDDFDCNRCAVVQLNRCVKCGLLQGCVRPGWFRHRLSLFLQAMCVVCVDEVRGLAFCCLAKSAWRSHAHFDVISKGLAFHALVFTRILIVAL